MKTDNWRALYKQYYEAVRVQEMAKGVNAWSRMVKNTPLAAGDMYYMKYNWGDWPDEPKEPESNELGEVSP